MNRAELLAALEKKRARMAEIHSGAKDERGNARSLNETEKGEFETLRSEARGLQESLSRLDEMDAIAEITRTAPTPVGQAPRIEVTREERHDDKGEYIGFGTLGEQLRAVSQAAMGRSRDPRLAELEKSVKRGMTEAVGSEGGFLVQTSFVNQLYANAQAQASIAGDCTEVQIDGSGIVLNLVDETSRVKGSRWGGAAAYWRGEGKSVAFSQLKFKRQELNLQAIEALYKASDELLEDTSALTSICGEAFAEELAFELDEAILFGDGVAKPLGVMNSQALISVAKESGQAAETILFENVLDMEDRISARSEARAKWYVHPDSIAQFRRMVFNTGTSNTYPVYLPSNGMADAPFATLSGKPIVKTENSAALGTPGDILLADFSNYLLIRKGGIKAAQSAHVQFLTSEMVFKYTMRVNGMPLQSKPITPAKGANTRSSFVALAVRA